MTLGLLAAISLLVVSGAGALYLALRAAMLAQFDAGLRVKALVVVTATKQRGEQLRVEFSDRFLREFDDELATDFFQVLVHEGKSVERSDSLGNRNLPLRFGTMEAPEYWDMELPRRRGAGRAIGIRFRPRFEKDSRHPDPALLDAVVIVAAQRGELDAMLRRIGIMLSGGGLLMLLATSLVVPMVLRPGLRPVRRLSDRAHLMDASMLGERFPADDLPSELRPICDRLNDLLARLESSFERERRFSADLAHELLTPLTEARAIADSALKWPDSAGPEDHRRTLEILARMEGLVKHVLELARAENGRWAMQLTLVGVADLINEVVAAHAAEASMRGIEVQLDGPAALVLGTDVGVLRVIVGNLVANAVAYAPSGCVVQISWSETATGGEIAVANPAPDLDPADLPRLFDRFWRKDVSRTSNRHSGLGLSLALELAAVLGGNLAASKRGDDRLVFLLRLPSAQVPESTTDLG